MCIKIVERYKICQCIYYSHAVDACPAYGKRGHSIKTKEILVGYTCDRHSGWHGQSIPVRSEDSEAAKALEWQKDGLAGIYVETATDSPLRAQLLAKLQPVLDTDERFISAGDFDELLTPHAIEGELRSHGLEHTSSFVLERARRVFAILLVVRKLDALQGLIKEDLEDKSLPLADSALTSLEDTKLRAAFSKWDLSTRKLFFEFQWTVIAPIFVEGCHYKFDDNARLPFIETKKIAQGGYGSVHRVKIHRDHETFTKLGSSMAQKDRVYALKQFTLETTDVNQRAFNRELAVLNALRSSGRSHLMGHLATFEQRGRYSMIFPLAEGDLRQFWAHANPSSVSFHQYLQQMTGIATAISYLHNDLLEQGSRYIWGAHMDLKPANILIMTDPSSACGRWEISDFGFSYLKPKDSGQELPPHPGLGTYEPPECQLNLPQSRAYDIWSLGCVFLECLIWRMRGLGAIDAFGEDRLNDVEVSGNMFKDDYFFTLEFDETFTPIGATTRPAVIKWIQDLERDPKCSKATSELLHLIQNELLQVDQSKRLNAIFLSQRLQRVHQSAKHSFESRSQSISESTSEAQVTEIED